MDICSKMLFVSDRTFLKLRDKKNPSIKLFVYVWTEPKSVIKA